MAQHIGAFALLVREYDEAIDFYVNKLGFTLLEDTDLGGGKRWVRVAPAGAVETAILLARAVNENQIASIGNQAGGRVWLFLRTDDFKKDYAAMQLRGVEFLETPRQEAYGMVVVFEDLYGNRWDLLENFAS